VSQWVRQVIRGLEGALKETAARLGCFLAADCQLIASCKPAGKQLAASCVQRQAKRGSRNYNGYDHSAYKTTHDHGTVT